MSGTHASHFESRASILRVAAGSIAVGVVCMAIKYLAYLQTGSVALYSDALESIVNVIASIAVLFAIRVSTTPADKDHPYGHHKAELFSAVLEGALIIVAALLIVREAYEALFTARPIAHAPLGIVINGAATAINAAWAVFLIDRGRRWRSPALAADGWHIMTDVVTSVGVLVGIALAAITGWYVLDPVIALAVAANILWAGYGIVSGSLSGLMDEAAAPEIQKKIRDAIRSSGGGALEAHDIRTRHAGRATFIEFHLVVPGTMSVAEAHEICDRIEHAIEHDIEGSDVIIHVEPETKAKSEAGGTISL